jgi:predicted amidohydrolase
MRLSAVVQSSSPPDPEADRAQARLVERAVSYGAQLIATPENTNFLGPPAEKVRTAEPLLGPTCRRFAALAGPTGIHLVLGPFHERSDEPARCHNTSVLFGPSGSAPAAYRKPG